jgi:hypothetical protein
MVLSKCSAVLLAVISALCKALEQEIPGWKKKDGHVRCIVHSLNLAAQRMTPSLASPTTLVSSAILDWDEKSQIATFKRKLRKEVKDLLVGHDLPTKFEEFVSLCIKLDNSWRERQQNRNESRASRISTRSESFSSSEDFESSTIKRSERFSIWLAYNQPDLSLTTSRAFDLASLGELGLPATPWMISTQTLPLMAVWQAGLRGVGFSRSTLDFLRNPPNEIYNRHRQSPCRPLPNPTSTLTLTSNPN